MPGTKIDDVVVGRVYAFGSGYDSDDLPRELVRVETLGVEAHRQPHHSRTTRHVRIKFLDTHSHSWRQSYDVGDELVVEAKKLHDLDATVEKVKRVLRLVTSRTLLADVLEALTVPVSRCSDSYPSRYSRDADDVGQIELTLPVRGAELLTELLTRVAESEHAEAVLR